MAENTNNLSASDPELLQKPATRRGRTVAWLALLVIVCIGWIILTRLRTADEPLERDICTQIMMGRALADGGKLYVDTIEFKPPGMFVIWQLIHELVGTGPRVVLWVNILVATLTLFGVFLAGSAKPWGRPGGIWAMGFWTLICGDMMLEANQPSNEVFMNLFMIWGLAIWVRADSAKSRRWHYAAAGLLLSLVTLIKQNVLVTVVCMTLTWVLAEGLDPAALKRRVKEMSWVWLPIAAAWGSTVLYFLWQGRGGAFYDCLVRYAAWYADRGDLYTSSKWMNILRGLSEELIPVFMVFLAPVMALTAWGIWGGMRGGQRSQVLTLAGCLCGTFLAVSIPGYFYAHYYQLYLPILAVGAGWGMVTAANSLRRGAVAPWIGPGTLLLLLWHIAPAYRHDGKTWSLLKYPALEGIFVEVERCGHAVNKMLTAEETFYVWGYDPGIYYYSDRRPASGIFWADRLLKGPSKAQATQKVIADLEKNQPPLILTEDFSALMPPPDHPIYKWIFDHYVPSSEAKFSRYFTVFIRRDSALAFRLSTNQQPFVLTLPDADPIFLKQVSLELLKSGRVPEAVAYLKKTVEIDPSHPEDFNNLAWLLATSPDAHIRNGTQAVGYAERSCALTHYTVTAMVGTLAAAYAEAGRYDDAISTAQNACKLASASDDQELFRREQEMLEMYRKHQPYHEATARP